MKIRFTVSRTGEADVLYVAVFKKKEIPVQTIRSTVLAVERGEKTSRNKRSGHPQGYRFERSVKPVACMGSSLGRVLYESN